MRKLPNSPRWLVVLIALLMWVLIIWNVFAGGVSGWVLYPVFVAYVVVLLGWLRHRQACDGAE